MDISAELRNIFIEPREAYTIILKNRCFKFWRMGWHIVRTVIECQ